MKKKFLIRNCELFQGEKYLSNNKDYFEGWYFKNTNNDSGISFIPGISLSNNKKKLFIQIITNDNSYYVNYDINDFEYSFRPFYIRIGKNYFSLDNIHIDIDDYQQELFIYGDVGYTDSKNIVTSRFNPNIMGIFSYIPFMECNHAILSMKGITNGLININGKDINLDNGYSYIEKDWGYSFPKSYIWIQGNQFQDNDASFMISIADIPFKFFHFRGLICSLMIDNDEYRFATYNNTKILKYDINDGVINIVLKKGDYQLYIESLFDDGYKLIAPVKGNMNKDIIESISSNINVTLKKKKKTIFSDTSINCGLEVVK